LGDFVVKGNMHDMEFKGSGLLLHPRTGGILCKMTVLLEKDKLCPLQIHIDDFASRQKHGALNCRLFWDVSSISN